MAAPPEGRIVPLSQKGRMAESLPQRFETVAALEDFMTEPTPCRKKDSNLLSADSDEQTLSTRHLFAAQTLRFANHFDAHRKSWSTGRPIQAGLASQSFAFLGCTVSLDAE